MSIFGKGVRCDGCGRFSSAADGYYVDFATKLGGNISSHGRNCAHDFCDECENKHAPTYKCSKCGQVPDGMCPVCGAARQSICGVRQATCGQPSCEAEAAGRLLDCIDGDRIARTR